jgi:hypothetical protein
MAGVEIADRGTERTARSNRACVRCSCTARASRSRPRTRSPRHGHWQFVNRAGETFTAGTAGERTRAVDALLPGSSDGFAKDGFAKVSLILSQDSLFAGPEALKDMPAAKALLVATGGDIVAVVAGSGKQLAVAFRPGLVVPADDRDRFTEALAQLRRPLDAARVRLLSVAPDGAATLPSTAKFDTAVGGGAIDAVDPDHIAQALASIPRQTAVLTARLEGALLTMTPATGSERTVALATLTAAARDADLDLVILHTDPPRQPGGRNWLWQRVKVSGLETAAKRGTFADFIDALNQGRGTFAVSVAPAGEGRITLTARQIAQPLTTTDGVTGWLRQATDAVTGQVTGTVTPAAVHANLVADTRRRELARRIIPGLPSTAAALYIAAAVLGMLAWPVARAWWSRLWPLEARADYDNARGFVLARAIRAVAFVTLFLPLAAIPAFIARLIGFVLPRKAATTASGN